ncbi:hypothetical protein BDR26DRAFT_849324 [Obelidium mucronatum]|nr:hypothetical protein BDR26DRAFT_849324 [Obelidium mucronatum]
MPSEYSPGGDLIFFYIILATVGFYFFFKCVCPLFFRRHRKRLFEHRQRLQDEEFQQEVERHRRGLLLLRAVNGHPARARDGEAAWDDGASVTSSEVDAALQRVAVASGGEDVALARSRSCATTLPRYSAGGLDSVGDSLEVEELDSLEQDLEQHHEEELQPFLVSLVSRRDASPERSRGRTAVDGEAQRSRSRSVRSMPPAYDGAANVDVD